MVVAAGLQFVSGGNLASDMSSDLSGKRCTSIQCYVNDVELFLSIDSRFDRTGSLRSWVIRDVLPPTSLYHPPRPIAHVEYIFALYERLTISATRYCMMAFFLTGGWREFSRRAIGYRREEELSSDQFNVDGRSWHRMPPPRYKLVYRIAQSTPYDLGDSVFS